MDGPAPSRNFQENKTYETHPDNMMATVPLTMRKLTERQVSSMHYTMNHLIKDMRLVWSSFRGAKTTSICDCGDFQADSEESCSQGSSSTPYFALNTLYPHAVAVDRLGCGHFVLPFPNILPYFIYQTSRAIPTFNTRTLPQCLQHHIQKNQS